MALRNVPEDKPLEELWRLTSVTPVLKKHFPSRSLEYAPKSGTRVYNLVHLAIRTIHNDSFAGRFFGMFTALLPKTFTDQIPTLHVGPRDGSGVALQGVRADFCTLWWREMDVLVS